MTLPIYDLQIMDGKKTLYYLKWIERFGFIKVSKEDYRRKK